jgi:hypothetical protein
MWQPTGNDIADIPDLADQLKKEGGMKFTQAYADQLTTQALGLLEEAQPLGDAGKALFQMTNNLLGRDV